MVTREQRVSVSVAWDDLPANTTSGSITVNGPDERRVVITVPIFKPASLRPEEAQGFVELNGYVSIEAEHFSQALETPAVQWKRIPEFGRTLSAMTIFPVTAPRQNLTTQAAHLEYPCIYSMKGRYRRRVSCSTQKFQPGAGFHYGISFDDSLHRSLTFMKATSSQSGSDQ